MTFNEAPTEQIRRAAIGEGMRTLYWDGIDKVLRGVTTLEEVSEWRNEPKRNSSRSLGERRLLATRHELTSDMRNRNSLRTEIRE